MNDEITTPRNKAGTTTCARSRPCRATIVGGSIAGLTAGIALLQRGWDVQIFEATAGALEHRGAGVITHQALFDVLEQLGVASEDNIGVPIRTRKAFSKQGVVIESLELPQIASSWGRVYQLLRQRFPDDRYHQNQSMVRFRQHDNHVDVYFADGTQITTDLVVAADGIRSAIRSQLEPAVIPEYVGYMAWRGLIAERDLSINEQRDILPYFTFCLPDGEQVLTYPIAGENHQLETGKRRCNVVWYRPASHAELHDMLTDVNGNNNGESIAPDKVRTEIIDRMRHDATRLLSPQHAALIQKLHQPFIQPIYDLSGNSMTHKRVVIIGDAAFTARPHLGIGITKAAEDALCLADELDAVADIPIALKNFESSRLQAGRHMVNRSRELGAYLQAQQLSKEERRYAEQHRSASAVLFETANPLA